MKKTACVIVNYNDSQRTLSLLKQIDEYSSIDFIIVVENCSTDDSYSTLQSYKSKKYTLVKALKNGGYGYGNNIGAKKAKEYGADYILIANPDVCFSNECVAHMKQTMENNPLCAVVGAKEIKLGVYAWRYTSAIDDILSTSLFFNKLLKKRYYSKDFFDGKDYAEADVIPGCFLLVDLSKFLEVGGYDENIFLYEEEKILYCRLKHKYKSIVDLNVEYTHNHVESHSYKLKSMLQAKERLLKSKIYFMENYRNCSKYSLFLCKIFFGLTLLEMFLWFFFRRIKYAL